MPGGLDIKGIKELGKALDSLPERLQTKVVQSGLRKAAQSMVAPLQSAAPVFTGRLEESIETKSEGIRSRAVRSRVAETGKLVVSSGIRLRAPGRYYWHFTEYGTVKMAARPWIRPTFAQTHQQALDVFKQYVGKRIVRETRKLVKEKGGG